jgi:cysteinyl-tRNA synthetase
MSLRVHNTLTRQKELFQTLKPGKVGMYLCGPTVYKPSHVGHMVGPVIFDTVKRYLQYLGYEVTWVVNITDIDDKLIHTASLKQTTVKELAEKMTADYMECLRQLNVTGIDQMPKATETIPDMIRIIGALIDKGYAYASSGDVYFDVTKDADYGKLCNRDPEQLEAGARIEISDRKRNPGDFALWKGSKPGEPSWQSPWGPGRPGWHIECTAMSMKLLGATLDIHGGGLDLQFPHHENELAQSESYSGQPFARYWMHNGLLKMGKGKMAGSVGNVINVVDALQKVTPDVLRFFLISTHYRSPIDLGDFDPKKDDLPPGLVNTQKALDAFHRFFERYQRITGESYFSLAAPKRRDQATSLPETLKELSHLRDRFLEHMDDDFNTGGGVGVLYEILTFLNRFADTQQLEGNERKDTNTLNAFKQGTVVLKELSQILGVFLTPPAKAGGSNDKLMTGLMQLLVDLRAECRKTKNFAMADMIRNRLTALGITLEDRPGGTSWRLP